MNSIPLEVANETLHLLPERALYWPRTQTLFIADPHFGKDATFRAHAIPLPQGTTRTELDRLSQAIERTGAQKLIILGDLLHAAKGREPALLDTVTAWRAEQATLSIYLVRGNHDRHAGDPQPNGVWRSSTARHPAPIGCSTMNRSSPKPVTPSSVISIPPYN
ncbi:MAG: metallophosphoesterase [Caldilineaceae bacterium]